jgi:hypothetical protein
VLQVYRFLDADDSSDVDSPVRLGDKAVRRLTEWRAAGELPPGAALAGGKLHFRILELAGEHGPEHAVQCAWEVGNPTAAEVTLASTLQLKSHRGVAAERVVRFRLPPRWQGHLLACVSVPADVVASGVAEIATIPGP